MKYLLPLLSGLAMLVSCSKNRLTNPVIIDPMPNKVTLDDTLYSGAFLGVRIGDSHNNIYDSLQQGWSNQKIAYLQVANSYNNLDSVAGRIPFYKSIYISEAVNVTVPIKINFISNQVESIYLGSNKVNQWPDNQPATSCIKIGDSRDAIYNKLHNIRNLNNYSQHFGQVSLGPNDLSKPFDPAMARSVTWVFTSPIDKQRFFVVEVFFTGNVISALHRVRYEPL